MNLCDLTKWRTSELVERVRNNNIPHVTRFGDGEAICLNSTVGQNCDSHKYSSDLGEALKKALQHFAQTDNLWLGNWFWSPYGPEIHKIVNESRPTEDWCDHDIFLHSHHNNITDITNLYREVRKLKRRKVLVRPERISDADKITGATGITVPQLNGWQYYNETKDRILNSINDNDLVMVCWGMPAKPLISEILKNKKCIVWDTGSAFDGLGPSTTRNNQLNRQEIIALYPEISFG